MVERDGSGDWPLSSLSFLDFFDSDAEGDADASGDSAPDPPEEPSSSSDDDEPSAEAEEPDDAPSAAAAFGSEEGPLYPARPD